jgi:hypothetical protein
MWILHVEAGYNTSTVALRVVRGARKETFLGERVGCGHKYCRPWTYE